MAAEFLENIVDEYTNIPVLLYAVQGSGSRTNLQSRKHTVLEDLHDAVSFSRLSSFCKLIVPVGLPSLSKSNDLHHIQFIILDNTIVNTLPLIIGSKYWCLTCCYFTNLNGWISLMALNCVVLYCNIDTISLTDVKCICVGRQMYKL